MIGLYCSHNTFIHRLRPGVKVVFLVVCTSIIFMVSSIPLLSLFLLLVILLYAIARIPFNNILMQLKSMSLFLGFIFILQVIFYNWLLGVEVILRLITLVLLALLVSLTTKVSDMVNSIETGLRPFQCCGINPSKFSIVLSMAIRFIPVISEKFHEVREAQRARGFETNIFALAVPLIIRTIKMAEEVAEALDARSYDGD
ncbi:energy-coupling factor transporter transmembrane component T family protein [Bartonella sp. CB189]|uniref:energy-coupling factor transporter transmembrane component T family protein n=1 Tax=Bartonella sp. CB189 TaxID=3112254 RepID=UPI002F96240B